VGGKYSKPQRQVEAAKIACLLVESGGGAAKLASGGKQGGSSAAAWKQAAAATATALDAAAGNPKLAAALERLEGLLAGDAGKGSKRAKQGSKPAAAKKQKV
jgi:hypothetical protein